MTRVDTTHMDGLTPCSETNQSSLLSSRTAQKWSCETNKRKIHSQIVFSDSDRFLAVEQRFHIYIAIKEQVRSMAFRNGNGALERSNK